MPSCKAPAAKIGLIIEPDGNSPLIALLNKGSLGLSNKS